jgi:uncharacterized membrane protein YphA (DoxX/SURF4 family)
VLAASLAGDVARIALGVALLAAGVAKIGQGRRWSRDASALGTPPMVVAVLPWLELATGAAIASGVASPWPAVGGVALVTGFTIWIVVQLAAGRHPACACFGAISTAPLSGWHVARNAMLIALGVVAAVAP